MRENTEFDWDDYLSELDKSGFLESFIGGVGYMKWAREEKLARKDGVLLAIAGHRCKRANGLWPEQLDQLKGKWWRWLARTPIDRVNGKPLSFQIKDEALVIYSLGDDDGGVNVNSDVPWLDFWGDGDWVLWPQASGN